MKKLQCVTFAAVIATALSVSAPAYANTTSTGIMSTTGTTTGTTTGGTTGTMTGTGTVSPYGTLGTGTAPYGTGTYGTSPYGTGVRGTTNQNNLMDRTSVRPGGVRGYDNTYNRAYGTRTYANTNNGYSWGWLGLLGLLGLIGMGGKRREHDRK